ncbi:hypothetical protein WP8W19C02_P10180 (plasmid) [Enterobacter cloacae]|nr:hypothetical protein WP8W19C02_P10180 [Enterobacter cloacae]
MFVNRINVFTKRVNVFINRFYCVYKPDPWLKQDRSRSHLWIYALCLRKNRNFLSKLC